MAIQINGNGTITGISVGGLPDGIVDTDMIAANAVTPAKSTITGGKLLQAVSHTMSSTFTTSQTTPQDVTGMSKAITPTAANSKILVIFSIDLDNENGSNGDVYGAAKILRSVDGGSYSSIKGQVNGGRDMGDGAQYTPNSLIILDEPSYSLGNAITYKLQAWSLHSNNTISVSQSNYPRTSNIVLQEIGA